MGRRGPVPRPTSIKILSGERKDRINTEEPVSSGTLGEPPFDMVDSVALAKWRDVSEAFKSKEVITQSDRDAVIAYCRTWSTYERLYEEMKTEEYTTTNDNGVCKANPKVKMMFEAQDKCLKYQIQFGFTPASRSSVKDPAAKNQAKENRLSKFVSRMRDDGKTG